MRTAKIGPDLRLPFPEDCIKCHRNNSLKSATVIEGFSNSKYRARTEEKQTKEEKSAFN